MHKNLSTVDRDRGLKSSRLPDLLGGLLLLILAILFLPSQARAQYRASLRGTVTDQQDAIVPGATVTLTNAETNETKVSTSSDTGIYSFNALPPAHFSITVEKAGFKKQVIAQVQVIPEQANSLNLQLEVGGSSETVNVNGADAPALETETASVSGTVSSNEIQHLPSFGRDVFQLAQLAPGVFGDGAQSSGGGSSTNPGNQGPGGSSASQGVFATENGPQVQSGGGQYESNSITVDGISTASAVWGGTTIITPSEDSVDNLKIISNTYDAENGRFSGAQMQITSKSGSNSFHGSLFFKADRPGLNAYQRWNGPSSEQSVDPTTGLRKTPLERGLNRDTQQFNDYGGSLGGPIWKNRIFAFFNYETIPTSAKISAQNWYETSQFHSDGPANSIAATQLSYPGSLPTSNAVLPKSCADIGLVEGTNCATIAGQGLDVGSPLKAALGTQDPTWGGGNNNPGVGGGLDGVADIAYLNTIQPSNSTQRQYNGRLDADATQKDHLSYTIYWVPISQTYYNGPARAANFWHHEQINEATSAIWNHIFTPTLLNEARANAAGWRWNEIATNPQAPFGLPPSAFDQIGSASLQAIGGSGASVLNQWTYSYRDIVTKVAGRHSLKFGGELTQLHYLNSDYYDGRPNYNFRNLWDFANDAPYKETGIFDPLTGLSSVHRLDERENLWGFFAQDDFKMKQNLTVNVGLRWSYLDSLYAKQKTLGVALLGQGTSAFTGIQVKDNRHLYEPQKNNFGPQLGFAWSPLQFQNKVVVRGGFGVNFNQNEIAITANGNGNPPGVVSANYSNSTADVADPRIVYAVSSNPKSQFGYPANPNTIATFGANGLPTSGSIALTGYDAKPSTIYTYHYSLDTQYDVGRNWIATLGYSGTIGKHLLINSNLNAYAAVAGIPLNPQVNSFGFFQNAGHSSYNAMLAGLKHQFSRSFLADAEYTWAKSMDTNSGPYQENPYPGNPAASWGRSDYNVGNAFKLYGLWQPTFFHGSRAWVEKVAGGWSISGIFNVHSGFPWTPLFTNTGGNLYYNGSGYGNLYPARYLGGAGGETSNSVFKSGPGGVNPSQYNRNYRNSPTAYYTIPTAVDGTPFPQASTNQPAFPGVGPFPQQSLVSRNSLNGPNYQDVDATLTKAFGLPKFPVLGESAKFEIRADAFNLFNKENLKGGGTDNGGSIVDQITSQNFGQATSALGSRTVEIQARFSF